MSDAQTIYDSAQEVANYYADKFNESSGVEQEIYREVCDAFRMFMSGIDDRVMIEKKDTSDYA